VSPVTGRPSRSRRSPVARSGCPRGSTASTTCWSRSNAAPPARRSPTDRPSAWVGGHVPLKTAPQPSRAGDREGRRRSCGWPRKAFRSEGPSAPIDQRQRQLGETHTRVVTASRRIGQHLAEPGSEAAAAGQLAQPLSPPPSGNHLLLREVVAGISNRCMGSKGLHGLERRPESGAKHGHCVDSERELGQPR
jgi:hypothetical protein